MPDIEKDSDHGDGSTVPAKSDVSGRSVEHRAGYLYGERSMEELSARSSEQVFTLQRILDRDGLRRIAISQLSGAPTFKPLYNVTTVESGSAQQW